MVFNQQVKVVSYGTGKYGRTIGLVYVGEKCLNEELIKMGLPGYTKNIVLNPFVITGHNLSEKPEKIKLDYGFMIILYPHGNLDIKANQVTPLIIF